MKSSNRFLRIVPYALPVVLFLVISLIYLFPVLEGKRLHTTDGQMFSGMAKEIKDYREETGEEALWTGTAFSGMPAYLISTIYKGELLKLMQEWMMAIPRPVGFMVWNFLFFFVLGLILNIKPWPAFAGSLAWGFGSFFFVIIGTGHFTKAYTLVYMALLIAGVLLAYRGKPVWGSLLAAFGLSWMISANHPQITYYAGMMTAVIGVVYLIDAWKRKELPAFFRASLLLGVAVVLAAGTNSGRLWTTWEYGKFSTRGSSELTVDKTNQTGGLNRNYILEYSYDIGEALTAFIPRLKGGGMREDLGEKSNVYRLLEAQDKNMARGIAENLPLYWGEQPISMAPFYYGAVLCFLFVLGLFVVKGPEKQWIVAVVILSFILSLGKNVAFLSNLMIDWFPGYDKFRDVKNIIVIQQFAMALMGLLAVRELYVGQLAQKELLKKLKYAWFVVGGLALAFVVVPGLAGDFRGSGDAQLVQAGWPDQLLEALRGDRRMALRTDAFRSLMFVSLAAGVIWLFIRKKMKASYAIAAWALLIVADLWPIDKKYLNGDNFETLSRTTAPFTASRADQEILDDPDPDYRVLNLTVNPFSDGSTSWFHKSLGGYHGAKMKRYQEVIDQYLFPEIQMMIKNFSRIDSVMPNLTTINMLNTKYIIFDPNKPPIENYHACGPAWFADSIQVVENANEEMDALGEIDPSETALVDRRFADKTANISAGRSGSSVELKDYRPNRLTYKAVAVGGDRLAVFSEIWYPKGWKAFIDGEETDILRVDYLLRALVVPEGEHEILFSFEPSSYYAGNTMALASSLVLFAALAGALFFRIKRKGDETN